MKRVYLLFLCAVLGLGPAGCARITSQVVEKPRVDQELGGNQGYLAGTPSQSSAPRKSTRQMIQTDIELPTSREITPWKIHTESSQEAPPAAAALSYPSEVSPAPAGESQWEEPEVPVESAGELQPPAPKPAPEAAKTYVVKKGDTLEKIAASEYGDSNQWRRIYNANRDRLSGPNKIYPGQKLVIPPAHISGKKHTGRQNDFK